METDALGYPKRNEGERYMYQGRIFTVIKNNGLTVLCPCADSLDVRYDDNDEDATINNNPAFERVN